MSIARERYVLRHLGRLSSRPAKTAEVRRKLEKSPLERGLDVFPVTETVLRMKDLGYRKWKAKQERKKK